jgi:hypothetical protein
MKPEQRHANFTGRLVMLGFGSIGQAMLPLLQRHLGIEAIASPSSRPARTRAASPRSSARKFSRRR